MDFPPISEKQHVEIYVRPNEEPEEEAKKSTFLVFVIVAILSFFLVQVIQPKVDSALGGDSIPSTPDQPQRPMPPAGGGSPSREFSSVEKSNHHRVIISECNGMKLAGAELRKYASRNSNSVKGVILAGTEVTLTGLREQADGTIWHEVSYDSELFSSAQPNASRLVDANPIGWIEGCFVEF
ncbi:MAG: hypothetical protein WBA57_02265 [Elainellaceae cyanobacterium]